MSMLQYQFFAFTTIMQHEAYQDIQTRVAYHRDSSDNSEPFLGTVLRTLFQPQMQKTTGKFFKRGAENDFLFSKKPKIRKK